MRRSTQEIREHVYLASNEWDGLWIIQQPIAREIGREEPVLYVEQFVSIFTVLRYPSKWRRLFAWLHGTRVVADQVRVLAPLPLFHLGHRFIWLFNLELAIQRRWILWWARKLGGNRRFLWFDNPQFVDAIGRMGEDVVIYHVGDDIAAFRTSHQPTMERLEATAVRDSDLVFVAATHLARTRAKLNPNTFPIANAVDPAIYRGALSPETEAEIAAIPAPRVAFVGMIDHWVDLHALEQAAVALPEAQFVVVGPWRVDDRSLRRHANVHLLGARPRSDVPGILRACSASIIPFRKVELTERIMPLKIFEALAAGIEPIATDFSTEVAVMAEEGWVTVAPTTEMFVREIARAMREDSPSKRQRLADYGLRQTWAERWREMKEAIQTYESTSTSEPAALGVGARQ